MSSTVSDFQVVQVPIDELRPDPANPRRISAEELDALTKSMRQFGPVVPIVARLEDRVVIGGHQRLVAARRLGLKTIPTIFLDVDLEQAHLLNLALNKISGEWDPDLLGQMLRDLSLVPDVDLSLSGFSDDELKKFLKRIESEEKRYQPEAFDLDATRSRS
jgi:ParB-like chromosome segregation protein Spo0J